MNRNKWDKVLAQAAVDSKGANPTTDQSYWDAVRKLCSITDEAALNDAAKERRRAERRAERKANVDAIAALDAEEEADK